jgi:Tfp pilus assembly protein PilO
VTNARERLLTLAALGGLIAAFMAAVQLPGRRAEGALRSEISRAEAEIARGPQTLEQFRAARDELARRQAYLDQSAESVGEPHDLLARVSRIAKATGLTVVRLEPEPVVPRASYAEHRFRLEFRGDLAALTDFLRGLEEDARLFALNDLEIKTPVNGGNGANLEGTILFTAFEVDAGPAGFAEQDGSPVRR